MDDFFSVFDQTFGPQPDEDEFAVAGVSGPEDLNAELFRVSKQLADTTSKHDLMRQQQLERATKLLQQRQYGPSLSERLLQMSAAFAQPSRTPGFAGVLGNVVPVLAQQMAQQRMGRDERADNLLTLENATQDQRMKGEQQGLTNQLALLRARIQANKPSKPQYMMHPTDGPIAVDTATGRATRVPIDGADFAGMPQPKSKAERDALPPGTEYMAPNGQVMRKAGGPTGSTPSGDFRNVP